VNVNGHLHFEIIVVEGRDGCSAEDARKFPALSQITAISVVNFMQSCIKPTLGSVSFHNSFVPLREIFSQKRSGSKVEERRLRRLFRQVFFFGLTPGGACFAARGEGGGGFRQLFLPLDYEL